MKNEEITTKLLEFEDKTANSGKVYTRFNTALGWMSCFEKETIDELKKNIGKTMLLGVATDPEKGFKNIRKCALAKQEKPAEVITLTGNGRNQTMWASYAKDIFVKAMDKREPSTALMTECINFIKQTQIAFGDK